MDFELSTGVQVLERTPATLNQLLQGISDSWIEANEGPETWSPKDVVGHLVCGDELDWIPRARRILEHGEAVPFDPFDRFAQFERYHGWGLGALLERLASIRAENLGVLRGWNLSAEQLHHRGVHPELGVVTLEQLLATWVVHDLGHIAQITRVMSKQYSVVTGPWKKYLPILTRA